MPTLSECLKANSLSPESDAALKDRIVKHMGEGFNPDNEVSKEDVAKLEPFLRDAAAKFSKAATKAGVINKLTGKPTSVRTGKKPVEAPEFNEKEVVTIGADEALREGLIDQDTHLFVTTLSLIHISEPTRQLTQSRMPYNA